MVERDRAGRCGMHDVAHFITAADAHDVAKPVLYKCQVIEMEAYAIRDRALMTHRNEPLTPQAGLLPVQLETDLVHTDEKLLGAGRMVAIEIDIAFSRAAIIVKCRIREW